ncbi:hypothetical protein CASFOL_015657 [Castilleja foliolosa]|uniref:Copper transport protein n=1 Tax=Castilleja foliolosa TaxID=1961234 RepID=A0ABD3DI17_9LAMI
MDLKPFPTRHNTFSGPQAQPQPPGAAHSHHRSFFHLAFYWGIEAQFLFNNWPDNSSGMYALALIFVFTLAIVVEFLTSLNLVKPGSTRAGTVFFQAGVNAIRAGFAYMVILAVMSYNGGVFIAALLGHAVGYVVFGSKIAKKETRPNT